MLHCSIASWTFDVGLRVIIYINQLIRGDGGFVFRNDNANDSQLQSDNDSRCAGESVS
jgi:hypothetical protein